MLNETWINKILLKLEAKKVAHRRNKGMNPHEIAQEMNCSEDWVKELFETFEDYEQEQEYRGQEAYERSLENWAEEHGAYQDRDGEWIV